MFQDAKTVFIMVFDFFIHPFEIRMVFSFTSPDIKRKTQYGY